MLSHDCELNELRDSLIKDMIIIGTNNLHLQEKLLSETDLTLGVAIKAGQTAEVTRHQVGLLKRESKEVNFIKSEKCSYQSTRKGLQKLSFTKSRIPSSIKEKITVQILLAFSLSRKCPPHTIKSATPAKNIITLPKCAPQTNIFGKSCRMTLTHLYQRMNKFLEVAS